MSTTREDVPLSDGTAPYGSCIAPATSKAAASGAAESRSRWMPQREDTDGNLEAMIGVIDYRTGNSQSVSHALEHLGVEHLLIQHPHQAEDDFSFVNSYVAEPGELAHRPYLVGIDDIMARAERRQIDLAMVRHVARGSGSSTVCTRSPLSSPSSSSFRSTRRPVCA